MVKVRVTTTGTAEKGVVLEAFPPNDNHRRPGISELYTPVRVWSPEHCDRRRILDFVSEELEQVSSV
jgi:hypothetical protein